MEDAALKIVIDEERRKLILPDRELELYSPEAFAVLSRCWLKVGWDQKHVYGFTWMGRPIIQLPDDILLMQEVIYAVKPSVIIETGVAHGGSLVFYASLCRAMGRGRVVGVDRQIREANRRAIEAHELASLITLIVGDSIDAEVVARVHRLIQPGEPVLVILDSNHTKAHVLSELEAYAPLVTRGSYIVATDGGMEFLADTPRGEPAWTRDNPRAAAQEFAASHPEFTLQDPPRLFNEGAITERVTLWPGAFLRRE